MKYRILQIVLGDRMGGQSDDARLLDETDDIDRAYHLFGYHSELNPRSSWAWVELVQVLESDSVHA